MKALAKNVARGLAVMLCVIAAALIVYSVVSQEWADLGTDRFYALSFLGFVVVGGYSIVRRPEHRIGWIMAGIGVGISVSVTADTFVVPLFAETWQPWVALVTQAMFVLGFGALVPLFFLWYPTGNLVSPRWRWLERAIVALAAIYGGYMAVRPGPTSDPSLDNPIGWDLLAPLRDSWAESAVGQTLAILALGAVSSLFVRFRRGTWEVRQQIRLVLIPTFVFIGLFLVFAFMLDSVFQGPSDPVPLVFVVGLNGIAIGVGLAIARYRLFEVDRLVARTVTYALVVGVLIGVVALAAATVGTRFDDPLVVAGTTLAVAAAFNPLRRRVQSWVDRRFNRSRYDAERVMDGFAISLRDEINTEELVDGWIDVVSETMEPASIGVWVKQ